MFRSLSPLTRLLPSWSLYKPSKTPTTQQLFCKPDHHQNLLDHHRYHRQSKCKTFGRTRSLSNRMKITTGPQTPFNPMMLSSTQDQHPCQVSRTAWRWRTRPAVAGLRWPTRNVSPRPDWAPTRPAAPPHWPCSASPGAAGGAAPPAASRAASGPRSGARWWTRSYWTRWMPLKRISGTFPTNFLFSNYLYRF